MAGIYLHIPFCNTRCIYCDFYSTTCRERSDAYIHALTRELELRKDYLMKNGEMPPIDTVYLGGGTPSTLSTAQLETIFSCLYKHYPVSSQAEITLEANPDDLTDGKIKSLRTLPVNRLSMGIQTFDEEKLRLLRRRHRGEQAIRAIKECQDKGIENISIDLIYGLPAQILSEWETDIETAIGLQVQHLSAYALIYEEGTALWKMREQATVREADEELSLNMYNTLIERLQNAGFEHYEISNFARPGFRSRHNSSYWKDIPYLGCGPSAHSFDGKNRQWNRPDLELYINKVGICHTPADFQTASWIEKETLSLYERYNDRIITALRTSDGLDLARLRKDFGNRLADYCRHTAANHIRRGLLEIKEKKEQTPEGLLCLTRQGLFLSDGIMSNLLWVEE